MKKISGSQNKIKDQMNANVSRIGNFNRSSPLHYSHIGPDFAIICQADQFKESYPKELCMYIADSLQYFLREIVPKMSASQKLCVKIHEKRITNLLVCCRQYIENCKFNGSFAFCFYYKVQNYIFCMKSNGLEIYLLDINAQEIIPVAQSPVFPFRMGHNEAEKGYFYAGMDKTKAEYMLQPDSGLNCQLHCIDKENQHIILMGSSECFAVITPEYVTKEFKNSKFAMRNAAEILLEEVKKKWRKIYQNDYTLVCCYV